MMKQLCAAAAVLLMFSGSLLAQESKGSYFSVSGNLGSSALHYDLNDAGTRKSKTGYGVQLGYSYFFNPNWGVHTGIGISHYKTAGRLNGNLDTNDYLSLGNQIDDDIISGEPQNYQLRARLANWQENQTAFLLEIPLMGMYQTRFGQAERWGVYGGLGVKLQVPVKAEYEVQGGSRLNISGYYPHNNIDKGAPGLPPVIQHGFGTVEDVKESLGWKDDLGLKLGVAATAEAGFLIDLGNDLDLMLGGYIDYGFTNIRKNKTDELLIAPSSYLPGANNHIGNGIEYQGILNSNKVDKVRLISFGVKLGLRFKL